MADPTSFTSYASASGSPQRAIAQRPADFSIADVPGSTTLRLVGDWIVLALGDAPDRLARIGLSNDAAIDIADLGRVDTAGAFALRQVITPDQAGKIDMSARPDLQRLKTVMQPHTDFNARVVATAHPVRAGFERIGRSAVAAAQEAYAGQAFIGQLVLAMARTLRSPRRLRLTPLFATIEQAGLAGLPIVIIMTFFIGAVLALVGSSFLQSLGVTVYAVELVGVGVLREFGAVIAAILFAGRSASAFAAELGSMKMNQEVDAMEVMGIDVFDALVVPRVLAALIMMPLLTLAADLGGLLGGLLVSWPLLSIDPSFFLQRLVDSVGTQQFWIGMVKAPFFAILIASTGCRQGLEACGDVEDLGRRVTAAVVQSIFLIIMFDAIFAVMFDRLGL